MGGFNTYPALDIKQPASPLDRVSKLNSLLGAQQQLQMGAIELDNARQQQLESQTLRTLFQKNAGDLGKTISDAAASGKVSPQTLTKLQADHLKMQTDLATKEEKDLKNALDSGNLFAGALDAVKQMPVDKRAEGVKSQLAILANKGINVAGVAKSVQGLPDLSDETINGLEASLIGHNKAVEQEMKRRDTLAAESTAKSRAEQAAKPTEASLALSAAQGNKDADAALKRLDQSKLASKPPKDTTAHDDARSDKSYQYSSGQLDKVGAPIEQAIQRFGRLKDTINQETPQADALVAPELLTVMAGGAGSGLRMNEAEISRIVKGRTNVESLRAALNKWQLDPSKGLSITPAQRQQIRSLMDEVHGKLLNKQEVLDKARQDLVNEDDPFKHRLIVTNARNQLTKIDMGEGASRAAGFKAPSDAPPAPKEDGKLLKSGGQTIAVSKGGQWVQP